MDLSTSGSAQCADACWRGCGARRFDKGCTKNCQEFFAAPQSRDRDVEWNMGPPLLEAELAALLSGGKTHEQSVTVEMRDPMKR